MQQNNVKYTIIVPVFKSESFLEECLQSIKSQTYSNFECFVINDGSLGVVDEDYMSFQTQDYSRQIDLSKTNRNGQAKMVFDGVVGNDNRFVYLKKNNGGSSSARNYGIKRAKGKWILCIDSDDFVEKDYLAVINSRIKDSSSRLLLTFNIYKYFNTGQKLKVHDSNTLTLASIIYKHPLVSVNYAINRSLVEKYSLSYDEDLGRGGNKIEGKEDVTFSFFYVYALCCEFGYGKFFYERVGDEIYNYRAVNHQMKSDHDFENLENFVNYMKNIALQNKYLRVRLVGYLYPEWYSLWGSEDFLSKVLKNVLTVIIKLLSNDSSLYKFKIGF